MHRSILVVLIILAVCGCATTKKAEYPVRITFDEATDFGSWTTFRFAASPTSSTFTGINQDVRSAIESNLTDRGYERIEDGTPDFRIAFEFATRGDHGSDIDRQFANEPKTSTANVPTKTNTLVVKMLDPISGEVLWEGRVSGFPLGTVQHKAEISKAVWRLFVEFPPITR
jgi:hypothetical protein